MSAPLGGKGATTAAVVVCTAAQERRELLRACVAAVLAGSRAPDEVVVVVDTNPVLQAELAAALPARVRVLGSERPGLSEARNAGIAATRSDVVAFVDDDAEPAPGWLAALLGAFADERVLGAGGPVLPRWVGGRRWMPDALLWVVGCTYDGHRPDAGSIRNPIGANMAFRRTALIEAGSFSHRFGKRGTALATCEETELAMRLAQTHGAHRIRFVPDAPVHHVVPATRVSWRYLVRRSLSEGQAKGRLRLRYGRLSLGTEHRYVHDLIRQSLPRQVLAGARRRDLPLLAGVFATLASLAIAALAFVVGVGREGTHQVGERLLEHIRQPLHRDGYALAINSAFTAATGLVYWILAAKHYRPYAVGLNSALISSMMFLAGIASLNLPNIVVRFLPESGGRKRHRVALAYLISVTVAIVAAIVFVVGVGGFAPRLAFLHRDHAFQAWFVLSTAAWCLFALQDSVLIALGRAPLVPAENAVFSVIKVVLLVALTTTAPVYGIFVSWTAAMLVSVVGVNLLIFAGLLRRGGDFLREATTEIRTRAFAGYFAADYVCSVAFLATVNLLPVIVTAVDGARANAYWALAYAIALPFYVFAQNIGTSLILHGTRKAEPLAVLTAKAARQGLRVLVPCVVVLALAAPALLSVFGSGYVARSTPVLRLLALGALPNFVLALAVSVARVQRRLRRAMFALVGEAALALGLATPLLHAFGLTGVAGGWIAAQCAVAAVLVAGWRRSPAAAGARAAPLPPAAASLALDLPAASESLRERLHPRLRTLFTALTEGGVRWMALRIPSRPAAPVGDVDLLVAPEHAAALRELAEAHGFVALPGWDAAPNLILHRYDRESDLWLVLDVCTAVSFRNPSGWELPHAAAQVLARRRRLDALLVPVSADAFWLVLLHCLLDKRAISAQHRAELRRWATRAADSPLIGLLRAEAGALPLPELFMATARAGAWDELLELGRELEETLRRRRSLARRVSAAGAEAARQARRPGLMRRRRGVSVALLGPNGVGKSTAAAALQGVVPLDVRVVYLGLWKGSDRGALAALAAAALRPVRVWGRYLLAQYHQLLGRVVIFDRYVYEALLPARPPLRAVKRPYFWLLAHALPEPSAVIVLDVPGAVAYRRKQENPPEELEAERMLFAGMTKRLPRAELVDASVGAEAVRAAISEILWQRLCLRWAGRT